MTSFSPFVELLATAFFSSDLGEAPLLGAEVELEGLASKARRAASHWESNDDVTVIGVFGPSRDGETDLEEGIMSAAGAASGKCAKRSLCIVSRRSEGVECQLTGSYRDSDPTAEAFFYLPPC